VVDPGILEERRDVPSGIAMTSARIVAMIATCSDNCSRLPISSITGRPVHIGRAEIADQEPVIQS
jgi:hypothetical protein